MNRFLIDIRDEPVERSGFTAAIHFHTKPKNVWAN